MSDSQAYEEVTVASDGVTVVKRFEEDEFPVPAIAFEFTSRRDETVTVELTDAVPEGVEVEDLGFHPEYGSEFWTIDDDQITFEKELEAGEEYTTVYGIRATGTDDVKQFLTEPEFAAVDPPLPDDEEVADPAEDVVPETDDDVVRDVISGDGSIPGLEEEEEEVDEDEDDVGTLDLKDPNASGSDSGGSGTDAGGSSASVDGSVISAMAEEIRENDVSMGDLKLLARAFEEVSEETHSEEEGVNEARIKKIQSDVADLRAYTDALEEFLDEEGTGEQLIRDFETRLDEFSDTLSEMESEVDSVTESVDQMDEQVSSFGAEIEGMSDDVSETKSKVEEFDDTISDLQERIDDIESEMPEEDLTERLDAMEDDLADLQQWQDQIKETFGG